jgi:hypothetical protein
MEAFYIIMNGFGKHEIFRASGKSFCFTELICANPVETGFVLNVLVERQGRQIPRSTKEDRYILIRSIKHVIYSNRKTHFSFEAHDLIQIDENEKLYVLLEPLVKNIPACESKLVCEIISNRQLRLQKPKI